MKEVLHLTGDTFQTEVLDYEGVALVDFWLLGVVHVRWLDL